MNDQGTMFNGGPKRWKLAAALAAVGAGGVLAFGQPRLKTTGTTPGAALLRMTNRGFAFKGAARGAVEGGAMEMDQLQQASLAAPAEAPASFAAGKPAARLPGGSEAAPRKIVRSASLSLEVPDEPKARALAKAAAIRAGAELAGDESSGAGAGRCATLTFRVAPERFEALIGALEGSGRVVSRSVSSQNLSEEFVDLRSRLSNLRRVEKRLTELLAFKTHKLPDVLQVERELERVGAEIEQVEGRMKYIDALAAQSVITVTLAEPSRVQEPASTGVLAEMRNAVVGAVLTFVGTGMALLRLTCWLAALALWVVPMSLLFWAAKKRWDAR